MPKDSAVPLEELIVKCPECRHKALKTEVFAEEAFGYRCRNKKCPEFDKRFIFIINEDMGKVTQKIKDIEALEKDSDLLNRFKKTLCAQAVREYLGMKSDQLLMVEIHLLEEELLIRLSKGKPLIHVDLTPTT
jgi:hypothetical protein